MAQNPELSASGSPHPQGGEWEQFAAPAPRAAGYRERRLWAALQSGSQWVVAAAWLMFLTISVVSFVQVLDVAAKGRQTGTPVTVQEWSHLLDPRPWANTREGADVARAVLVMGAYLMLCWLGVALWGLSRCAKAPLLGAKAWSLGSAILLSAGVGVAASLKPLYGLALSTPVGVIAQQERVMGGSKEYWAYLIEAVLLLALVLTLLGVGCFQHLLRQVAYRCRDQALAGRLSRSFLTAVIVQGGVLGTTWLLALLVQLGDPGQRGRALGLRSGVTSLGLLIWLLATGLSLGYGSYLVAKVNAAVRRAGATT